LEIAITRRVVGWLFRECSLVSSKHCISALIRVPLTAAFIKRKYSKYQAIVRNAKPLTSKPQVTYFREIIIQVLLIRRSEIESQLLPRGIVE